MVNILNPSLHCVIVGWCGFSQEAVITLFTIKRTILNRYVWLFSSRSSGNMKYEDFNGHSINRHYLFSFYTFYQYSDSSGQSQYICMWSSTKPHPLQHYSEVLLHFDVTWSFEVSNFNLSPKLFPIRAPSCLKSLATYHFVRSAFT